MRLIDADALKEMLIKERDAIPLTKTERYGFGVEFPDPHGTSMRGGINKAFRCMEQTPTIDAVPVVRWIPVTERLPERDGCYIVTACDEGCPYGEGIWYDTVVVMAEYYDDGRWLWYEGETEYDLCDIVTHWMPLPEPPMRKGENDNA